MAVVCGFWRPQLPLLAPASYVLGFGDPDSAINTRNTCGGLDQLQVPGSATLLQRRVMFGSSDFGGDFLLVIVDIGSVSSFSDREDARHLSHNPIFEYGVPSFPLHQPTIYLH